MSLDRDKLLRALQSNSLSRDTINNVLASVGFEPMPKSKPTGLKNSKDFIEMVLWDFLRENKKIQAIKEMRGLFAVMAGEQPLSNYKGYRFYEWAVKYDLQIEPLPETISVEFVSMPFPKASQSDLDALREKLTGKKKCTYCGENHD